MFRSIITRVNHNGLIFKSSRKSQAEGFCSYSVLKAFLNINKNLVSIFETFLVLILKYSLVKLYSKNDYDIALSKMAVVLQQGYQKTFIKSF